MKKSFPLVTTFSMNKPKHEEIIFNMKTPYLRQKRKMCQKQSFLIFLIFSVHTSIPEVETNMLRVSDLRAD